MLLKALVGDDETEALFSDAADLAAILAFEMALAEAEADAGLITDEAAAAIAAAVAGFAPDMDDLAAGMARDGVVVPALVRQLRGAVGKVHGEAVHLRATSQDAIDTSLVMRLGQAIGVLEGRLEVLIAGLSAIAGVEGGKPLMGYTRMQAALPITVADKVMSWVEPLLRERKSLMTMRCSLLVIQLGGAVGNRGSFDGQGDAVARGLAERLGLGLAAPWQSQRDPLVEFAGVLGLISGSLGKFGVDVGLMAQAGAVTIAGGGGSSAMAHKVNPVNAEVLVSLARFNAGLVGTMHQAMVHENERSGAAWTLEWIVLPQIVVATAAGLRLAETLVGQLQLR